MFAIVYLHANGRREYCTTMKTMKFSPIEVDAAIIKTETNAREYIRQMYHQEIVAQKGPGKLVLAHVVKAVCEVEIIEPEIKQDGFVLMSIGPTGIKSYYSGQKTYPRQFRRQMDIDYSKSTVYNTYKQALFAMSLMQREAMRVLRDCTMSRRAEQFHFDNAETGIAMAFCMRILHCSEVL